MQEIDQHLHKALKSAASYDGTPKSRERATEQLRSTLESIREPALAAAAKSIHEYFLARRRRKEIGDPAPPPLEDLSALRGLYRSYDLVLGEVVAEMPTMSIRDLLAMRPTLRVIEAWLKAAEELHAKRGANLEPPREELLEVARQEPEIAIDCGLGEWFVGNVPAESLLETLPLLAAAFGPTGREQRARLVAKAIARDRSGNLLLRIVGEVATDSDRLAELARIVRNESKTFEKTLELLPKALLGSEDGRLGELIPMLFNNLDHEKGFQRRRACGGLIEFYGKLLAVEGESTGLRVALAGLDDLFRRFENLVGAGGQGQEPLRVVRAAGEKSQPHTALSPVLTIEQAKILGAAIERLRENSGAIGVVEALAANLGLESVGACDQEVCFDPLVHEDRLGGRLPGDRVVVRRPGWKLGDHLILRAVID